MGRRWAATLSVGLAVALWSAGLWLAPGGTAQAGSGYPPPRPSLAPTAAPPAVGAIRLEAAGAPATAWTVVQWQDGRGGWHDVEGWQGDLDEGQAKVWWVLEKDFGTGPFRWVVLTRKGGGTWKTSEAFTLPDGSKLVVIELK
jgi:hypothetical protein